MLSTAKSYAFREQKLCFWKIIVFFFFILWRICIFALMKRLPLYTLLMVCALLLTSCGGSSYKEKVALRKEQTKVQQRLEQKALKIGITPTIDCLPVLVAQQEGYLVGMPDSFRIRLMPLAIEIDQALVQGKLNVGVSDVKRLERANAKQQQLLSLGKTNLYWLLVASKSSRIKEPRQLGDKLVGMTRFSALDYLTDRVLADHPTKEAVYKIQVNDPMLRLEMLHNSAVDALWLPEPQITAARLAGYPVLADSRKYEQQLALFVTRAADLKQSTRSAQLQQFVEAYNRAADLLNKQGWSAYAPLMKEQFKITDAAFEKLPKFTFTHLTVRPDAQ